MKHRLVLALILIAATAAVVFSERSHVAVTPSPSPLLYLVADAERDLMRIPVSLTPLSDQEETAIGDRLAKYYLVSDEVETPEDKSIGEYVRATGADLARHAHRKLTYRFHYLHNPSLINAFAIPGGHIFIGKGLLDLMDTEDELAAVLGHEIEHVELMHCAERAQIQQRIRRLPLEGLFEIPIEIFEAGYSKEQELDADREGTVLAVTSGYSAAGAISMFRKFEKLEAEWRVHEKKPRRPDVLALPGEMADLVVLKTLEEYFRSHPPATMRIARLERLSAEKGWPQAPQRPFRLAYMLRRSRAARLLEQGQVKKAKAAAQEALALNPNDAPALNLVGDIDYEEAAFSVCRS